MRRIQQTCLAGQVGPCCGSFESHALQFGSKVLEWEASHFKKATATNAHMAWKVSLECGREATRRPPQNPHDVWQRKEVIRGTALGLFVSV